jgi:acetylglutamate kinase
MPIIIKIGGVALEQQRAAPELWRALLDLHQRSGVVLVHGGGKAVDALLAKLSMPTQRREGIRITPPDQMDVIAGVLAGSVNKSLVGAINAASDGARTAVGLCLGDGGAVRASKATRFAFDPGRVGEVDLAATQGRLIATLLRDGFIPVLSSIGIDDAGDLLNINADDAAAALAKALSASALVLLTDVEGVKDERGSVVPTLDHAAIERMIASGAIAGGMIPKVRAALDTSRAIAAPVTIMSGSDTSALERWAKGEPVGTRVA